MVKKFWGDFKKFISKGSILDLAVAVIIGAAFGKIVTSLTNDMLMPLISLIFVAMGLRGFAEWKWVIEPAEYGVVDGATVVTRAETALYYGKFIQSIFDFFIIALCIFIIFRTITRARTKVQATVVKIKEKEKAKKGGETETAVVVAAEEPKEEPPKEPSTNELLAEIRDLLSAGKKEAKRAEKEKGNP